MKINPLEIKKILLIKPRGIGDIVLSTIVLDNLKHHFPFAKIDYLTEYFAKPALKNNPLVNEILTMHKSDLSLKVAWQLRKRKYDLILGLVFNKTTKIGLIANLIGTKKTIKVSISHTERNNLYYKLFNILINVDDVRFSKTMVEIQAILLSRLFGWNYNINEVKQGIYFKTDDDEYYDFIPPKAIFFNISAGNPKKELSLDKNIELIDKYMTQYPQNNILLHSAQQDYNKAIIIRDRFKDKINYVPFINNILEICKIIKQCEIVISPVTSITHIGATFGKKVIILVPNKYKIQREWLPYCTEIEIKLVE
jgi:ADP-heptose:LPS heptosyltransferase